MYCTQAGSTIAMSDIDIDYVIDDAQKDEKKKPFGCGDSRQMSPQGLW